MPKLSLSSYPGVLSSGFRFPEISKGEWVCIFWNFQEKAIVVRYSWLSLHTSQVAHQAGAYPGFCNMKQLEVFLLPPGWDASPSQGYPQH